MAEEEKEGKVETIDEGSDGLNVRALIAVIVGGIVLVGLVGFVLIMIFSSDPEDVLEQTMASTTNLQNEFQATSQSEITHLADPIFVKTQLYAVNLRDGRHYLKMSIIVVLQDPMAEAYLNTHLPIVDDIVISILKTEDIDNLRTRTGMELLKRKLFKDINKIFLTEFVVLSETKDRTPVKDILINQFVLN